MRILALDLSTSTGYAIFEDGNLVLHDVVKCKVDNFNVQNFPNKQDEYPYNIIDSAKCIMDAVGMLTTTYEIDYIVIENTVRGQNRHTQRVLEFIHYAVLEGVRELPCKVEYLDPSEWRKLIGLRLTIEDKKHNKLVKQKKAKKKVTYKHLSVRYCKEKYDLELKMKDNDIADAICLGTAYLTKIK